jgi:hypothetical protein
MPTASSDNSNLAGWARRQASARPAVGPVLNSRKRLRLVRLDWTLQPHVLADDAIER